MSSDRDPRFSPAEEPDDELEEDEAPRSIFAAAWFRVVLVLLGIGVVGAVAVPYVLDVVNPPETPAPRTAVAPTPTAPATPPAKPAAPAPSTAPAAPSPAPSTSASAPKPAAPAPSSSAPAMSAESAKTPAAPKPPAVAEAPKADAKKAQADKPAEKPAEKAAAKAPEKDKPAPRAASAAKATESGDYFVQVGAFREQATAKRVAARLREQNYPVDESVKRIGDAPSASPRPTARAATSGPDRYDVIVSGGSSAEINTRLAAKGLASEPQGDGVRIRPSLPLRDAVALSKDLGSEGFKVQVRRGGGAAPEPAPPAATASDTGGQTLYRVRVGGYPDRAAAQTVLKELQDKGFQPFIAKGRE